MLDLLSQTCDSSYLIYFLFRTLDLFPDVIGLSLAPEFHFIYRCDCVYLIYLVVAIFGRTARMMHV